MKPEFSQNIREDIKKVIEVILHEVELRNSRATNGVIPIQILSKKFENPEDIELITRKINEGETHSILRIFSEYEFNESLFSNKITGESITKLLKTRSISEFIFGFGERVAEKNLYFLIIDIGRLKNIKAELEKIRDKEKQLRPPVFEIFAATTWKDIEIKFKNQYDIEIYIEGKFLRKSTNEELGFFKRTTKDKKPDKQWEFLHKLSVMQNSKFAKATIETMAQFLNVSKEACMQIKSKLSEQLKEVFGINNDEPFDDYKLRECYQTKFKLKPEPELRGNGGVFMTKTRYDENYEPESNY